MHFVQTYYVICDLMTPYSNIELGQHWPRQWLVDGTKRLPEPVSNFHQWGSLALIEDQLHRKFSRYHHKMIFELPVHCDIIPTSRRGQCVKGSTCLKYAWLPHTIKLWPLCQQLGQCCICTTGTCICVFTRSCKMPPTSLLVSPSYKPIIKSRFL